MCCPTVSSAVPADGLLIKAGCHSNCFVDRRHFEVFAALLADFEGNGCCITCANSWEQVVKVVGCSTRPHPNPGRVAGIVGFMATATQTLPPFLQQLRDLDDGKRAVECSFTHSERLGLSKSHCLWWPSVSDSAFETVVLFIPGKDNNYYATEICSSNLQVTGNPGLVGFYEPFLDHIYSKSRPGTAILAHARTRSFTSCRVTTIGLHWPRTSSMCRCRSDRCNTRIIWGRNQTGSYWTQYRNLAVHTGKDALNVYEDVRDIS